MYILKQLLSVHLTLVCLFTLLCFSCRLSDKKDERVPEVSVYKDVTFIQESHIGYQIGKNPADNE